MSKLTQKELKEELHYNKESGVFTWIKSRPGVKADSIAGCQDSHGYESICLNKKPYKAHRLAFLYINGVFPCRQIDHINHKKDDNSWNNLRVVSPIQNSRNKPKHKKNTSGFTGVCWHKKDKKWQSQIKVNAKTIYLGNFDDKNKAIESRKAANIKYGFHENHGE